MKIFVTGAGGFVGSNLAHVFRQRHGAEVIAPSHDTVDLTDRPLLHRCPVRLAHLRSPNQANKDQASLR